MGFKPGQDLIDRIRGKKERGIAGVQAYSQDGEDVVLAAFYEAKPKYKGFYVDIGALHPLRFSNTQFFYERGWKGINIDATPGSMEEFKNLRPLDINIEAGITNSRGKMHYYMFKEPALNSFDEKISKERIDFGWELLAKKEIETFPINEILERYLPGGQKIDFINIDIEGLELQILESFDFSKYSPDYFLIEALDCCGKDFFSFYNSPVNCCLNRQNYFAVAKTQRTIVYGKM